MLPNFDLMADHRLYFEGYQPLFNQDYRYGRLNLNLSEQLFSPLRF